MRRVVKWLGASVLLLAVLAAALLANVWYFKPVVIDAF